MNIKFSILIILSLISLTDIYAKHFKKRNRTYYHSPSNGELATAAAINTMEDAMAMGMMSSTESRRSSTPAIKEIIPKKPLKKNRLAMLEFKNEKLKLELEKIQMEILDIQEKINKLVSLIKH